MINTISNVLEMVHKTHKTELRETANGDSIKAFRLISEFYRYTQRRS